MNEKAAITNEALFNIVTNKAEETWRIGEALGGLLKPGDMVCLYGDLGSGKTNFSYGVARGLGIQDRITSPTFTLANEYHGRIPLYHLDLYRLKDEHELENIGFEKYVDSDGATLVEWADRAEHSLPHDRLNIYFSYAGETCREVGFFSEGERSRELLAELRTRIDVLKKQP
jgi:tRNA threonylcarbamoyladenosine biosynthesis protein TsaE